LSNTARSQRLSVYFWLQTANAQYVLEEASLRESVNFRQHNEGSGEKPLDTENLTTVTTICFDETPPTGQNSLALIVWAKAINY